MGAVFAAARGVSLAAVSRSHSLLRCTGSLLWWLLLLWNTGSRHTGPAVAACGLEGAGFSSCDTGLAARGMWELPGHGWNPYHLQWQTDS